MGKARQKERKRRAGGGGGRGGERLSAGSTAAALPTPPAEKSRRAKTPPGRRHPRAVPRGTRPHTREAAAATPPLRPRRGHGRCTAAPPPAEPTRYRRSRPPAAGSFLLPAWPAPSPAGLRGRARLRITARPRELRGGTRLPAPFPAVSWRRRAPRGGGAGCATAGLGGQRDTPLGWDGPWRPVGVAPRAGPCGQRAPQRLRAASVTAGAACGGNRGPAALAPWALPPRGSGGGSSGGTHPTAVPLARQKPLLELAPPADLADPPSTPAASPVFENGGSGAARRRCPASPGRSWPRRVCTGAVLQRSRLPA